MAVGLPLKTTYANGDVYSASDVNDTNGTINLFQTSLTRAAGKNPLVNGGMDIWQRGTSVTVSSFTYTADRWQAYRAVAGATVTRQVTGDTTNLPQIQYCMRVSRDAANAATNQIFFAQSMETTNSIPFAGQTVTFSFYARKGANYSPTSSAFTATLNTGTGTDQNNLTSGYTGGAATITINSTLTTTWQRFTGTAILPSTTTEIAAYFTISPTGVAGAADYMEITGIQVELGSYATTFTRTGGSIQGELAACQRYYYQHIDANDKPVMNAGYFTANIIIGIVSLPVTMRTSPTISVTNGTNYWISYVNGAADTFDTLGFGIVTGTTVLVEGTGGVSATGGNATNIRSNNANARLGMSAEL
jgi:hypothetical protein